MVVFFFYFTRRLSVVVVRLCEQLCFLLSPGSLVHITSILGQTSLVYDSGSNIAKEVSNSCLTRDPTRTYNSLLQKKNLILTYTAGTTKKEKALYTTFHKFYKWGPGLRSALSIFTFSCKLPRNKKSRPPYKSCKDYLFRKNSPFASPSVHPIKNQIKIYYPSKTFFSSLCIEKIILSL